MEDPQLEAQLRESAEKGGPDDLEKAVQGVTEWKEPASAEATEDIERDDWDLAYIADERGETVWEW